MRNHDGVAAGDLNAGAGVGRQGRRVRIWGDVMRVLLAVLLVGIAGCGPSIRPTVRKCQERAFQPRQDANRQRQLGQDPIHPTMC